MATLRNVFGLIADTLRAELDGVDGIKIQVEPRPVFAPAQTCIDIFLADPSDAEEMAAFGDAFGGEKVFIRARIGSEDMESGYDILLDLMDDEGPLSVYSAVMTDPTFNGNVQTLNFDSRSSPREFPGPNGEVYLGVLWALTVVKGQS